MSLHSYVHCRNIQDRMCSGPLLFSVNVTWWCAESMDFVADAPEGRAGLLTEVRALEKAFSKVNAFPKA